ncbi:hypothetical protein LguiA_024265 [Lonicera macranthoides]
MGACASKPKDLECNQAPIPSEAPASPSNPEAQPVPQENSNEGENKKEEPLVDISEPAGEEPTKNAEEVKVVSEKESSEVITAKPSSEVEETKKDVIQPAAAAAALPAEDKVEAQKEAMEPAKEAEKKEEVPDQDQIAADSSLKQDKNETPLPSL